MSWLAIQFGALLQTVSSAFPKLLRRRMKQISRSPYIVQCLFLLFFKSSNKTRECCLQFSDPDFYKVYFSFNCANPFAVNALKLVMPSLHWTLPLGSPRNPMHARAKKQERKATSRSDRMRPRSYSKAVKQYLKKPSALRVSLSHNLAVTWTSVQIIGNFLLPLSSQKEDEWQSDGGSRPFVVHHFSFSSANPGNSLVIQVFH